MEISSCYTIVHKGDKSSPGNYRLVSLTSVVCKLMESVVRDRIIDRLAIRHLLSDCQHGFIAVDPAALTYCLR